MKYVLTLVGLVCLFFAVLGIFLPLLPTTPFLLLSAILFGKSSPRFYHFLLHHKIFGAYIRSYREDGAISMRIKVATLLLLWGSILFSILIIATEQPWLQLMLFTIAMGVSIHVLFLKTKKATK